MPDDVGRQFGNYRLVRLLGQGGFSEVYLGKHIYLNTLAAVKILYSQPAEDEVEIFHREAHTLALLIHPNIVRILEFGVERSIPFLVMDYAPNGSLRQRHPKGVPLQPLTILPYVKQLGDALQYAHDQNIIHRDVKPQNMLLGRNDEVLLTDFGIAIPANPTHPLNQYMTGTESMAGTVGYMAPEQLQGHSHCATDQYALGAVIYEWLSGDYLFQGKTIYEIYSQHLFSAPRPLREKVPNISPSIEEVVLTALAKDPNERFPNIQEFANVFEDACNSRDVSRVIPKFTSPSPILQASTVIKVPKPRKNIEIFFSYSHKDELLRDELAKHLRLLKRQGLIRDWHDRDIGAGTEWANEIDTHLKIADVVLLLVSPDFIDSDYCYDIEMMRALERHEAGEAIVIPIILRPTYWKEAPFGKLQALPTGAKPITAWQNRDEAFLDVVEGIQKVIVAQQREWTVPPHLEDTTLSHDDTGSS